MAPDEDDDDAELDESEERHAVLDALRRIGKDDEHGLIQPETVVANARDPASPLHTYFEWDDSAAAHQHRLAQARRLIRQFRIIPAVETAPAYVNVRITTGDVTRRGYVSVERAVADPALYPQVIADAHRGMVGYRNRLAGFRAVADNLQRGHVDTAIAALDTAIEATRPTTTEE